MITWNAYCNHTPVGEDFLMGISSDDRLHGIANLLVKSKNKRADYVPALLTILLPVKLIILVKRVFYVRLEFLPAFLDIVGGVICGSLDIRPRIFCSTFEIVDSLTYLSFVTV